jgi:hypothetical protein
LAACTRVNSSLTGPTTLFWMAPIRLSMQYFQITQDHAIRYKRDENHQIELLFYLVTWVLPNGFEVCGARSLR